MDHNMERTNQMLALIYAIIETADTELKDFLRRYSEKIKNLEQCNRTGNHSEFLLLVLFSSG